MTDRKNVTSQYNLRNRTREITSGEEVVVSAANNNMLMEGLTIAGSAQEEDGASGAAANNNPTTADLMNAIAALQKTVDNKLTTISSAVHSMQATLSTVTGKVRDIEEAVSRHDDQLATQEALCKSLQESYDELRKKLLQDEFRSRRQNIRITGIVEGEEGNKPADFVSTLIPKLLGDEDFPTPVLVDIAHRVGPKPTDGYNRPIIAKIHYLREKMLITKLAAQKSPLEYNRRRVSFFPDQPKEVYQQKKKFNDVRKRCKDAGGQSGFVGSIQTRLRVTIDGATRYFDGPDAAKRFLDGRRPRRVGVDGGAGVDDGGGADVDGGGDGADVDDSEDVVD